MSQPRTQEAAAFTGSTRVPISLVGAAAAFFLGAAAAAVSRYTDFEVRLALVEKQQAEQAQQLHQVLDQVSAELRNCKAARE